MLYAIIFNFYVDPGAVKWSSLWTNLKSVNPSFFFASSYRRLFVPTTLSKFAWLDSTSFCLKILPLHGCGDFHANPLGLELVHSNLLFNFVVGTIKHQATGRPAKVRGEIRTYRLLPFPSFAEANGHRGFMGWVFVKGYQTKRTRTRNWLFSPAILNALAVISS